MSYTLGVSTADQGAKASVIANEIASMEQQMQTLNSHMQELATTWTGKGSQGFARNFETWAKQYKGIRQTLDGLHHLLKNSQSTYETAEQHVISSMGSAGA